MHFLRFSENHLKDEVIFVASPNDTEPHGREIFASCVRGDFGEVAACLSAITKTTESDARTSQTPPLWPGWPRASEFIQEANLESARGTLRGMILVSASMIDEFLGNIIEAFLIDHSISRDMIWKDSHGPLSTFSGRSNIAFCLGLINKDELRVCDSIRVIRNVAAHEWKISLDNQEVANKALPKLKALYDEFYADKFLYKEDLEFLIKLIYVGSCTALAALLARRQTEAIAERRQLKPRRQTFGGASATQPSPQ